MATRGLVAPADRRRAPAVAGPRRGERARSHAHRPVRRPPTGRCADHHGAGRRPTVSRPRRPERPTTTARRWERPRRYEAYPTIRPGSGCRGDPRVRGRRRRARRSRRCTACSSCRRAQPGGPTRAAGASQPPRLPIAVGCRRRPVERRPRHRSDVRHREGDTLLKIATQYTDHARAAAHGQRSPTIKNPDKIAEGQQIVIRSPCPRGSPTRARRRPGRASAVAAPSGGASARARQRHLGAMLIAGDLAGLDAERGVDVLGRGAGPDDEDVAPRRC